MTRKFRNLCLMFGFLLVVAGCTIGGAAFQKVGNLEQDEAIVYIYRPRAFFGGGVIYDLYASGKKLTSLVHTSYIPYVAPAGKTTFKAVTQVHGYQETLELTTEPGKTYYIKGDTHRITSGRFRPTLTVVPNSVGEVEIKECVRY